MVELYGEKVRSCSWAHTARMFAGWSRQVEKRRRAAGLRAGAGKLREGDRQKDVDKSICVHGFAPLEAVPLQDPIAQT